MCVVIILFNPYNIYFTSYNDDLWIYEINFILCNKYLISKYKVFIIFIIYFSSKLRYTSMQYLAAASKSTSSSTTRKTSVAILKPSSAT